VLFRSPGFRFITCRCPRTDIST